MKIGFFFKQVKNLWTSENKENNSVQNMLTALTKWGIKAH